MQELHAVQSEGRLQRSAWESQNSALHSQVSGLREAICQREVRIRELEEQVEVEQAELRNVKQQVLEEAGAKRHHEARCLAEAAEARAALLQAESHATQKGQLWEQHRSLEVAEVQLYHKLEMCEDATAKSRTKHQHLQAESRVLSLECEELNTKWLGATETIGCLELDTQKLESQAERFRSIEREKAEADAQGRLVRSQLWRLEREESTCKQALAASRAASSRHEQQLCEQEEDLGHMRLEQDSAQIRQRALESQNEALQSWCSSLQEQNLQLESVRTEEAEMHWLSEYRETDLLRQRLLVANESQADAFGREATLCEEVNCLREANAAFENTMGEIKCRHQQLQAESESRQSECEELTASWLSAREEVDSMRLAMQQLKAQIRNAQEKNEQLVVDCKAFKKECAENQEQSARLQLHVRQCRMHLAALQQEAVMEGSHFLPPASQVQRSIWDSRNAGLRSQVPGKGVSSDAPRAVQAYEFQDQLQTDKELSQGMFSSSAEPECALLLPALAWQQNKGEGAHDASLQPHVEEQLHRLSHQSISNPDTAWGADAKWRPPAGGHTTNGSTRSASAGVCRCRLLLRNACLVIWRHWAEDRKYAQCQAITYHLERRWPLALAFSVWARSSETATFRIRHGLHLFCAAVLSAQRRCLLQATRCWLGSSNDTVLVTLTDAASVQSDRMYKRRRSVVDRFVVGHLPARRRVLQLALRAWRDASCTCQTCGHQTERRPSALQSKAGSPIHVDETRQGVRESKPKTKASIPTILLLQTISAWRGVVRARRARNKS
ncbi:unnamed protein product [Symbiodinium sp. CCMP2592]|nr:unnamed protein product [Symbiodinium sp. CCMP2592]